MVTEVILPKLGQTMEEGTIVEWVKQEGDPIKRGDLLFTVESDKAVLEVETKTRGFLRRILVHKGQTVPVLTVVALITRTADEDISSYGAAVHEGEGVGAAEEALAGEAATPAPSVVEAESARAGSRISASPRARKTARAEGVSLALLTGTGPGGRIVEQDVLDYLASLPKATPVAVKTAESLGVDLATVSGTGVGGRIVRADVLRVGEAAPTPAEAPISETVAMTGLRRIIAERMAASDTQTARVTLVTEADATAFAEARERLKTAVAEAWGLALSYNDLLGLVVSRALREFPYMNARLGEDGQTIERLPFVNLGMAVDTERGLLVPVIRDAAQKGLHALSTELHTLLERARQGKSLPDDLSGGTFTITNLGMHEVDAFTPIINLPEAAILGVGRIQPKPVVHDGEIAIRQMLTLSLAFDHRLVDGAPAARFLQRIKQLIENPYLLLG
jgi:pyruvate dehydrogenase E2 component (dihydrolipoamide acetyltransferase)